MPIPECYFQSGRQKAIRGFTVIELLVVMGVITVLAAFLFPSLNRVRDMLNQTTCLSNIRQIGVAMTIYAADNSGNLPYQPTEDVIDFANPSVINAQPSFLGLLLRYIPNYRKIYVCPNAWETPWVAWNGPSIYSDSNYMANAEVMGRKIVLVHHASTVIILQEDKMLWDVSWLRPCQIVQAPAVYTSWHWNGDGFGEEYDTLHYNEIGGNLLFVDGHGEYKPYQMLKAGDFGLDAGAGGSPNDNYTSQNYASYLGNP